MRSRNTVVTIDESPCEEESLSRTALDDPTRFQNRSNTDSRIASSLKELPSHSSPSTSCPFSDTSAMSKRDKNLSGWRNSAFVLHIYFMRNMIKENELSWRDDFLLLHMMSIPKSSELFMRLNLNVPYYIYNYVHLMFLVTFPMLVWYNIPYLLVLTANVWCCFLIVHDSFATTGKKRGYIKFMRYNVRFVYVGHLFVLSWIVILLFFNGARTALYVTLANLAVVVPHALLRRPTFFDDEEMEKLRPKMVNYILMMVFILLSYLEGDISGPEDENLRRSEEERKRIKAFLQREESDK